LPKFLDLFVAELRRSADTFRDILTKGKISGLDDAFRQQFEEHWHTLRPQEGPFGNVAGIDSSRATRMFANGSFLHIARAIGISSWKKEYRYLRTGLHAVRASDPDMRTFLALESEFCEHTIALDIIQDDLNRKIDAIFIDGSLYGRMTHVPIEFNLVGHQELPLSYMEKFVTLLEECKRRSIVPIGISKDSRVSFLSRILLDAILRSELLNLEQVVPRQQLRDLKHAIDDIETDPTKAYKIIEELKQDPRSTTDTCIEIVREYMYTRPDFQLIGRWVKLSGYTTPLELGLVTRGTIIEFSRMAPNQAQYVRRRFRNALLESETRDEFVYWGSEVVRKMLDFPSIVTFHLLPDHRDTPLRIDIPSWALGMPTSKLKDFEGVKIAENLDPHALNNLLNFLMTSYGGLENYNIWLTKADVDVRLGRNAMDTLYEPLLERELRTKLRHERRYRRVVRI